VRDSLLGASMDREALKALASQREALESEMEIILERLNAPGMPGVKGHLVDAEGFPRADIDVHAVRTDRHRLAVLKTDHERVTQQLETGLQSLYAATPRASGLTTPAAAREPPKRARLADEAAHAMPAERAFAVADDVSPGSPASTAGLCVGDLVVCLGTATTLEDAPTVVAQAAQEGATLAVRVLRGGAPLSLSLAPHSWSGRGVLGCHLKPLSH
jgi:26S proteasome regulatory subunit N4